MVGIIKSFKDKIKLYRILQFAVNANLHANTQIIKGSTQLDNNNLTFEQQKSLANAIGDENSGIRGEINEVAEKLNEAFNDEILANFVATIKITSKFSLGNCHEMAMQALSYSMLKHPNILSEIFVLNPGDHTFLVLGRSVVSNPNDPETWGSTCVVCDPWANNVFPASEYNTKLTGFTSVQNTRHAVPYYDENGEKLVLVKPLDKLNSTYLRDKYVDFLKQENNPFFSTPQTKI